MGSFVKSLADIRQYGGKPTTFYDAEMLTVYWETKPEIIERLLPKPLKPAGRPLVNAFIADYPATNFCPPYREAGLFVLADYNGELGNYCLSMPITSDIGMAMGREVCGLPKKMADVRMQVEGDSISGSIGRQGIDFSAYTLKWVKSSMILKLKGFWSNSTAGTSRCTISNIPMRWTETGSTLCQSS